MPDKILKDYLGNKIGEASEVRHWSQEEIEIALAANGEIKDKEVLEDLITSLETSDKKLGDLSLEDSNELRASVAASLVDELKSWKDNEHQTAIVQDRVKEQQSVLAQSLPTNHPLLAPVDKSILELGRGSFSKIDVTDLKGNVQAAEKLQEEWKASGDEKKAEAGRMLLPILRYINLGNTAIELRYHQDGKQLVSAFKVTQNGRVAELLAERMTAENLLHAISERALNIAFTKHNEMEAQKQLENVTTFSDY